MNLIILKSILDTLGNVEVHGKDNMLRMVACMNALEQLIQEASQPVQERPTEQPQSGDMPAEAQAETTEGVVADGK